MKLQVIEIGNPFPGLRSFDREQAHLFFGRDEQIMELSTRLTQHRFLPIVGVSGSGKSSLVRAGLIPALTDGYVNTEISEWRIAVMRPGRNPMHELAETLSREFLLGQSDGVLQILRGSSAGLARVAQQYLRHGEGLMVLVDQFEEIFRYRKETDTASEANDAAAFVKLLLGATGLGGLPLPEFESVPVYVVTTMRSEFLGACSQFRGLPEALNQTQYLIPRLTREQQREVIEGPIGMAGGTIEPALVQRLLNDLGDNPDQLPALQHALMRTWERARGKAITVADYEAVGGMAEALNRDADRVYESLSDDEATIARRIFQRLVRPGAPNSETRSPVPLSDLVAITAADKSAVWRVISVFKERDFLTVSSDQDPIVDITHESLIREWDRLRTWVQEEAQSAAIYRRLAETPELYASGKAVLLKDPELQVMLNWVEKTAPNEAWAARYDRRFAQAIEFLERSRKERDEERKQVEEKRQLELERANFRAFVWKALLLLVVGVSIFAFIQWWRAGAERDRSGRLLYDSNIYFASSAVASGQFTLARDRLDEVLNAGLTALRGFEWFHLWRVVHADEATLSGHTEPVTSVAFSRDGKILASASFDDTVKLWDTATRKELATLSGHSDDVRSVAFSPDSKTLASASDDNMVKLWDIASRKELATLTGHANYVSSVAFSPDGKTLASGSFDNTVKLWDVAARIEVAALSGHSRFVMSVAFSPDGKTLASASADNTVKLWDTTSRKELATLSGHSKSVMSVAFSPDGKTLASASFDNTVKFWDTTTHEELATLAGSSNSVMSIAFSPDGKTLAYADDTTVKLWDTATHQEVATLAGHSGVVVSVAFSPDGKTLGSASGDNTIKLWDTTTRPEVAILSGHSNSVWSVAFSPDGKTLASASFDSTVKLWDIIARKELATLSGHSKSVWSVAFSPDGKTLASASDDTTVKLWDIASRKELASLAGHSKSVMSVAFSPDGKLLASASADNTVKLWDTTTRTEVATLSDSNSFWSVAFSPDGKVLASASVDNTVKLWETATRKKVATLEGHTNSVWSVAFSPDGKTLASAGDDNTVKLWDTFTGKPLGTLWGHSDSVWSVAFSPDGKTLASASDDKTVKLWDTAAHKELATLSGNSDFVRSVAFSPDSKTLAAASNDATVKLRFAATVAEVEERGRRGY